MIHDMENENNNLPVTPESLIEKGFLPEEAALIAQNNDIFGSLVGYKPTPIEEKKFEPKVLNGKYNAIITKFERNTGTWPSGDAYDQYQCTVKLGDSIEAKVEGNNIYVSRTWNLLDTQYKMGEQSLKDMFNELNQFVTPIKESSWIVGFTPDEIFSNIDMKLKLLIGEQVAVRVWPQKYRSDWKDKKKGEYKTDKNGYVKHSFAFASRVFESEGVLKLD